MQCKVTGDLTSMAGILLAMPGLLVPPSTLRKCHHFGVGRQHYGHSALWPVRFLPADENWLESLGFFCFTAHLIARVMRVYVSNGS